MSGSKGATYGLTRQLRPESSSPNCGQARRLEGITGPGCSHGAVPRAPDASSGSGLQVDHCPIATSEVLGPSPWLLISYGKATAPPLQPEQQPCAASSALAASAAGIGTPWQATAQRKSGATTKRTRQPDRHERKAGQWGRRYRQGQPLLYHALGRAIASSSKRDQSCFCTGVIDSVTRKVPQPASDGVTRHQAGPRWPHGSPPWLRPGRH